MPIFFNGIVRRKAVLSESHTPFRIGPRRCAPWPAALALAILMGGPARETLVANETAEKAGDPAQTETKHSADEIQSKLKALESSKEGDEEERAALAELYGKILQQLKRRDEFAARAESLQRETAQAPEKLRALRAESAAPAEPTGEIDRSLNLSAMLQQLSQAETRLTEVQTRLADLQSSVKRRADRGVEVPRLQETARLQIKEVSEQLETPAGADETTEATEAARQLLEVRQLTLHQELKAYDAEIARNEATADLLSAQRDQAVVQAKKAQQALEAWQAAVNEQRRVESEQQALAARQATAQAHPSVKRLAAANADLAARRQELARNIEQSAMNASRLERRRQSIEEQYERLEERVHRAGLTETEGLLMRKHRDELPSLREHYHLLAENDAEISAVTLEFLELEDQRGELADLEPVVAQYIAELDDTLETLELILVEAELKVMLSTRREYLDALIADTREYSNNLSLVGTRERELVACVRNSRQFVDERILWIRSTTAPRLADLPVLISALGWLSARAQWSQVKETIAGEIRADSTGYAALLLFGVLMAIGQYRLKHRLRTWNQEAAKKSGVSFLPTVASLGLSLLLAVGLPALVWLAGWKLADAADRRVFAAAVGRALQGTALLLALLEMARQICRSHGLGEAHFDWPGDILKIARRSLGWFIAAGLPAAFVVLLTEAQPDESWKATLGRTAFVWSQLLVAWCAYRIWHAPRGLVQEIVRNETDAWWRRFQRFWYLATVTGPLALVALAVSGYYYTAVQLAGWALLTLCLLFSLIVLHALMLRWVLLAYRELAMRRARERRAAEAAASTDGKPPLAENPASETAVSLADISQQTRSLLRLAMCAVLFLGTWLIWEGGLPALGILQRVQVWPLRLPLQVLDVAAESSALTLADIILAALIAVVTLAASRNVPGLLELTILRRLSLDAGARYAVGAISKYVIGVVGIVAAVGRLGIGWSQVQWLVAAVSVGLGFGLQEIFANFVSGLILLFERPIRIGDIVSVADVTGKVSRIRIRATTITDWDLRELVVPNREFVTGRVMNWTLSDTLARMTVRVGVVHGCNPDLVRQVLLDVARNHPLVRHDPPPHALLDEIGDKTLIFTLRVYMSSLDVSLQLRHELQTQIIAALARAGIDIPYPQRDLHLRTTPELVSAPGQTAPARQVA
ncbi:MAG: mechanosensitive ion channel domain-containing protein [Planctomycetaceae bacterium]